MDHAACGRPAADACPLPGWIGSALQLSEARESLGSERITQNPNPGENESWRVSPNLLTFVFTLIAVATTGCGTARIGVATQTGSTAAMLTGASVTFQNRDSAKDAKSAVAIELLRNNAELAAESELVGTEFDDNATPLLYSTNSNACD